MPVVVVAIAVPVLIAAALFYFEPGFLDRDEATPATAESSGEDRSGDGGSGQDPQTPEPEQLAMEEPEADREVAQTGQDDDQSETRQRRRRVRTPPPEDDDAGDDPRTEPRERIVTDPDEAMEEVRREVERAERRMAQREERAGDERRRRTEPPADEPTEEVAADNAEEEPAAGEDDSLQSGVAEYVRAWELPLAVRREMPDLDLSIHVFAPEEEKRFVLINGERRMAGDELGGGARLVEIRREGALIDFRDHRFLLEP